MVGRCDEVFCKLGAGWSELGLFGGGQVDLPYDGWAYG